MTSHTPPATPPERRHWGLEHGRLLAEILGSAVAGLSLAITLTWKNELESQLDDSKHESERLRTELRSNIDELASVHESLTIERGKYATLAIDKDGLDQRLKSQVNALRDSQAEAASLRKANDASQSRIEAQQKEMADGARQRDELAASLRESGAMIESLTEQLAARSTSPDPASDHSDSSKPKAPAGKRDASFWGPIEQLQGLKSTQFVSIQGVTYHMRNATSTFKFPSAVGGIIADQSTAYVIMDSGASPSALVERRKSILRTKGLPTGWEIDGDPEAAKLDIRGPNGSIGFDVLATRDGYDVKFLMYFEKILNRRPSPQWVLAVRI